MRSVRYKVATYDYPFTEQESLAAFNEWGANCGPNALAFALQIPIAQLRGKIPHFEERRYTSPSMMKQELANLGKTFRDYRPARGRDYYETMFAYEIQLVRVQWTGPWTEPGANPKWAYRQTHWIACWSNPLGTMLVFDCNGGINTFNHWEKEIVPALTKDVPRADGGWFPTHVWRLGKD